MAKPRRYVLINCGNEVRRDTLANLKKYVVANDRGGARFSIQDTAPKGQPGDDYTPVFYYRGRGVWEDGASCIIPRPAA